MPTVSPIRPSNCLSAAPITFEAALVPNDISEPSPGTLSVTALLACSTSPTMRPMKREAIVPTSGLSVSRSRARSSTGLSASTSSRSDLDLLTADQLTERVAAPPVRRGPPSVAISTMPLTAALPGTVTSARTTIALIASRSTRSSIGWRPVADRRFSARRVTVGSSWSPLSRFRWKATCASSSFWAVGSTGTSLVGTRQRYGSPIGVPESPSTSPNPGRVSRVANGSRGRGSRETLPPMSSEPRATTQYAVSSDGTRIAYEVTGSGPALVVVEGALCHRRMGAYEELGPILADRFSVVGYDRRGRGESEPGATAYEVQREVEDLVAVLDAVDPDAFVFGMSSGAALSLEAARQGLTTSRLAVYEPPFILDDSHPPDSPDFAQRLRELLAEGRRTKAVQLFLRLLGVPAPIVLVLPLLPMWKRLTAAADTLPHDFEIVAPYRRGVPLPEGHYATIVSDTLLAAGGKSPDYMRHTPVAIATQIPGASTVVLEGQTHEVKAEVLAPVLARHFAPDA